MNIKQTMLDIAKKLNAIDHSGPGVQELHDALWHGACRHRKALGVTDVDLREIGNAGNVETFGGGTGKTPPEPDG